MIYLNQLENAAEEEQQTAAYKWASLFLADGWEELKRVAGRDEYMSVAVEEMEKINADKNLRYQYLMEERAEHDAATYKKFYMEQGLEKGIQAMVLDGIDDGLPKDKIVGKLMKRFELDRERAERFYGKYRG